MVMDIHRNVGIYMKIKHILSAGVIIGLTNFTAQDASANTIDSIAASANVINTSEEFLSQIKIFDGNGEQIPYTIEELQQIITFIPNDSTTTEDSNLITPYATYNSKAFSFKDYIYLNGGDGFYNPTNITVDAAGTKAYSFFIYNKNHGTEVHRMDVPNGVNGGFHMSLTSLTRGYDYSFKFQNFVKGQTVSMNKATVSY